MEQAAQSTDFPSLLNQVDADLGIYRSLGLAFREDPIHSQWWNRKFQAGTARLIGSDARVNAAALKNFLRSRVFIGDDPRCDLNAFTPRNLLLGSRRGRRAVLKRCLEILEEHGLVELLRKYPCPTAGNPWLFEYEGLRYTHRWFKHIYALGRVNALLRDRLGRGFVAVDIGAGHGMFQNLVYQEYPGCHQVLVDLPESLLLARYYLGTCFPQARIAGPEVLHEQASISRELIEKYDFVLLPSSWYEKLQPGSADMITSFACLGELKREFFEYYVGAPVFRAARYLFTINPISAQSFIFKDSDVTILDYPIWTPHKKIHFGLCPAYFHSYGGPAQRFVISYESKPFPPFFEYLGVLHEEPGVIDA